MLAQHRRRATLRRAEASDRQLWRSRRRRHHRRPRHRQDDGRAHARADVGEGGSACAARDTIAALEEAVERDGTTTRGSRNQIVVHPALLEIRQLRLAESIPTAVLYPVDGDHMVVARSPGSFVPALVEACDLVSRRIVEWSARTRDDEEEAEAV